MGSETFLELHPMLGTVTADKQLGTESHFLRGIKSLPIDLDIVNRPQHYSF